MIGEVRDIVYELMDEYDGDEIDKGDLTYIISIQDNHGCGSLGE